MGEGEGNVYDGLHSVERGELVVSGELLGSEGETGMLVIGVEGGEVGVSSIKETGLSSNVGEGCNVSEVAAGVHVEESCCDERNFLFGHLKGKILSLKITSRLKEIFPDSRSYNL